MKIKNRDGSIVDVLAWLTIYKINDTDYQKSIVLMKENDVRYQLGYQPTVTYVGETESYIDSTIYSFETIYSYQSIQDVMIAFGSDIKRRKLDKSIIYFKVYSAEGDTPEMQMIYKDLVTRAMKIDLFDDEVHEIKRMKVINELIAMKEEEDGI